MNAQAIHVPPSDPHDIPTVHSELLPLPIQFGVGFATQDPLGCQGMVTSASVQRKATTPRTLCARGRAVDTSIDSAMNGSKALLTDWLLRMAILLSGTCSYLPLRYGRGSCVQKRYAELATSTSREMVASRIRSLL
jgi:hypothetical protein